MTAIRRHAAKRDVNESAIVDALRSAGCDVWRLSQPGIPDLLVTHNGWHCLMEVKQPGKKLTPAEALFHASCNGPCGVVYSVADALDLIAKYDALRPAEGPKRANRTAPRRDVPSAQLRLL